MGTTQPSSSANSNPPRINSTPPKTESIQPSTPREVAAGKPNTKITAALTHTALGRLQPKRSIKQATGTSSSDTAEVIAAK